MAHSKLDALCAARSQSRLRLLPSPVTKILVVFALALSNADEEHSGLSLPDRQLLDYGGVWHLVGPSGMQTT